MPVPPLEHNDELLSPFLEAPEGEEEVHLEALLDRVQPVLHATLHRKALYYGSPPDLEDELMSAMTLRIIEQLRRCKQSYRQGDNAVIIRQFSALCQTIAFNTINEYLRLKYPRRARLQNQLLYIIREAKDDKKSPLFALWRDVEERICGFYLWEGRKLVFTSSHHLLETNPRLARKEAMPTEDATQQPLSRVLHAMLKWLGAPAAFDAVVQATLRWRGIEEQSEVQLFQPSEDEGFMTFEPVAPDLSPEERLILNEHLQHLWQDITKLPPKQCAALLLNLCDAQGRGVLGFLPALQIATFDQIAATMDMELQQFAALWPQLPLDDRQIAEFYGCGVSSVSVWRSRARARLLKNAEEV